jgi:Ca2+-binding RTX toxin-like protein
MPNFTFTGDQTRFNATGFSYLVDFVDVQSAGYITFGGETYVSAVGLVDATASQRFLSTSFSVDPDGQRYLKSLTGYSYLDGGMSPAVVFTAEGLRRPVDIGDAFAPETVTAVNDVLKDLFRSDDAFLLDGDLSTVWGDYELAPSSGGQMGDDYFVVSGTARVANSVSAITIYGDARVATEGTRGGNDLISSSTTVAVLAYGDFASNTGKVSYGDDVITSGRGNDRLYGDGDGSGTAGGDDILEAYGGSDYLYGGGGDDLLLGGTEGDYIDGGSGFDTIRFATLVNQSLVVDLENQTLNTAEAAGDTYIGVEAIIGRSSLGIFGQDDLRGDDNGNRISGLDGNDTLTGRGGNDRLYGGLGADTMYGGTGDDIMEVDNAGDVTVELAGEGYDIVRASATYTMTDYVERLELTGWGNIDGFGNSRDNRIFGNVASNRIDGLGGNDEMSGGEGDDTYYVRQGGDTIIEKGGEGADTVRAYVSWTLGANLERLYLQGSAEISATGNGADNTITGNGSANRIDGRAGDDRLSGGAGRDSFVFSTSLGSSNVDTISDFDPTEDLIRLTKSIFSALGSSVSSDEFVANSSGRATNSSQHIIYETDTGKVFYDSNGSGSGGLVQFAQLESELDLHSSDFVML